MDPSGSSLKHLDTVCVPTRDIHPSGQLMMALFPLLLLLFQYFSSYWEPVVLCGDPILFVVHFCEVSENKIVMM